MSHTTYTDPSGYDDGMVSTDLDQLRLAQVVAGCLMFRAVWHTGSGSRSVIGVVLGQRGGNLLTAGLSAARQLVDRMAPNAGAGTSSSSGSAGRPSPGQPGLGTPPGAYRRHIENQIRAGNTTPP